jgi:hypothetical protein
MRSRPSCSCRYRGDRHDPQHRARDELQPSLARGFSGLGLLALLALATAALLLLLAA